MATATPATNARSIRASIVVSPPIVNDRLLSSGQGGCRRMVAEMVGSRGRRPWVSKMGFPCAGRMDRRVDGSCGEPRWPACRPVECGVRRL